jgi:hypothetical protein
MVSGPVPDPKLSIHNHFIVRRHLFAALLSRFQLERVPDPEPGEGNANIFESLGGLRSFRTGGADDFSYEGLRAWMSQQEEALIEELEELLPIELIGSSEDPEDYIRRTLAELLEELQRAGAAPLPDGAQPDDDEEDPEEDTLEELDAQIANTQSQLKALASIPGMETMTQAGREKLQRLQKDRADLLEQMGPDVDEDLEEGPEGTSTASTDPSQNADERKLLDRLFAQGILPRYAFPTSVVALHVFDRTRSTSREAVIEHAPQRDLNQALSSYAPGREVWINGERHYSFAIWAPFERDRRLAWSRRQLYLSCDVCGFAELRSRKECARGDTDDCKACGSPGKLGPAMYWMRPPGFAHPYKLGRALPTGKSPAPTRPTRARLHASFSQAPDSELKGVSAWTSTEKLIVTNTGAHERGGVRGFRYCVYCGLAEPNTRSPAVFAATHDRPSPDHRGKGETCSHNYTIVSLGNEFRTDVAVLRFKASKGITLRPSTAAYSVVLKTLAVALTKAAVSKLDIEPSDIAGEYRVALSRGGQEGREVEIFLYDMAAGGAGFVRDAIGRRINEDGSSEEDAEAGLTDLLERTLKVLKDCPNKQCTSSCYQCLRSYKNKWDHADLDRYLAAAFLENCMHSTAPSVPAAVEERLLKTLELELLDAEDEHEVELRSGSIWLPELNRSVVVSHPLRPELPATTLGKAAVNPVCISQLIIERNLPLAHRLAIHGPDRGNEEDSIPAMLQEESGGLPFYKLSALGRGESPIAHVLPPAGLEKLSDPSQYLLAQVDTPVLDRVARKKEILLLRRAQSPLHDTGGELVVLRRHEKSFAFTGETWAVGSLQSKQGGSQLHISYRANAKTAINETAAKRRQGSFEGAELVAVVRKVIDEIGGVRDINVGKSV